VIASSRNAQSDDPISEESGNQTCRGITTWAHWCASKMPSPSNSRVKMPSPSTSPERSGDPVFISGKNAQDEITTFTFFPSNLSNLKYHRSLPRASGLLPARIISTVMVKSRCRTDWATYGRYHDVSHNSHFTHTGNGGSTLDREKVMTPSD